jgi:hypothetical protein
LWTLALKWQWERNAIHSACRLLRSFTQVFNEMVDRGIRVRKKDALLVLEVYADCLEQLVVGNKRPCTVSWVRGRQHRL